jgi:hypothetical protein
MRGMPINRPQSPSNQNELSDQQFADDWLWHTAPQNN